MAELADEENWAEDEDLAALEAEMDGLRGSNSGPRPPCAGPDLSNVSGAIELGQPAAQQARIQLLTAKALAHQQYARTGDIAELGQSYLESGGVTGTGHVLDLANSYGQDSAEIELARYQGRWAHLCGA